MMGKYSQWLLVELERNMTDVPEDRRREILNEVRSHLGAATEARVELGMSVDEADREAVEEFGNAKDFEKSMRETVLEGKGRGWIYGSFAAGLILTAALPVVFGHNGFAMVSLYITWWTCGILLAWHSFKVGRVLYKALPAVVASCVLMTAVAAPFVYMNLYASGGMGYLLKAEADEVYDAERLRSAALSEGLVKVNRGIAAFRPGSPDSDLAHEFSNGEFIDSPHAKFEGVQLKGVEFLPGDASTSIDQWRTVGPNLRARLLMERDWALGTVSSIEKARTLNYFQSFAQLAGNASAAMGVMGALAFALHCFAALAGAMWRRVKSLKPRWPRARAYQ